MNINQKRKTWHQCCQDKAALEELKSKVSEMKARQTGPNMVRGALLNITGKDLQLNYVQVWSGHWVTTDQGTAGPPQVFSKGSIACMIHQGAAPDGSKVGIKYTSTDGLEWIVAWCAPIPSNKSRNKAYYGSGKSGTLPSWEEIEKYLDGNADIPSQDALVYISQGENAEFGAIFISAVPL